MLKLLLLAALLAAQPPAKGETVWLKPYQLVGLGILVEAPNSPPAISVPPQDQQPMKMRVETLGMLIEIAERLRQRDSRLTVTISREITESDGKDRVMILIPPENVVLGPKMALVNHLLMVLDEIGSSGGYVDFRRDGKYYTVWSWDERHYLEVADAKAKHLLLMPRPTS